MRRATSVAEARVPFDSESIDRDNGHQRSRVRHLREVRPRARAHNRQRPLRTSRPSARPPPRLALPAAAKVGETPAAPLPAIRTGWGSPPSRRDAPRGGSAAAPHGGRRARLSARPKAPPPPTLEAGRGGCWARWWWLAVRQHDRRVGRSAEPPPPGRSDSPRRSATTRTKERRAGATLQPRGSDLIQRDARRSAALQRVGSPVGASRLGRCRRCDVVRSARAAESFCSAGADGPRIATGVARGGGARRLRRAKRGVD